VVRHGLAQRLLHQERLLLAPRRRRVGGRAVVEHHAGPALQRGGGERGRGCGHGHGARTPGLHRARRQRRLQGLDVDVARRRGGRHVRLLRFSAVRGDRRWWMGSLSGGRDRGRAAGWPFAVEPCSAI